MGSGEEEKGKMEKVRKGRGGEGIGKGRGGGGLEGRREENFMNGRDGRRRDREEKIRPRGR